MRHLFSPGKRDQERRDELLSAYLDDELSDRERERLEAQLAADADLRSELEALRRTVTMTRDLPAVSAPRNFILSPSMVAQDARQPSKPAESRSQLGWAAPILTAVTATVSLLFVLVLAGDLLLGGVGFGGMVAAPPRQEASPMAMEAAPTEEPVESERADVAATEAPPSTMAEAPEEEMSAGEEGAVEKEAEEAAEAEADEAPTLEPTIPLPTPALTPTVTAPSEIPTAPAEATPVPREGVGIVEPTPEDWENVTPTPLIVDPGAETPRLVTWRALEITLGLTAVILLVVTIRAWRDRR